MSDEPKKPRKPHKDGGSLFKKGKSGNPGGRPKVNEIFREKARKAVDDHVLDAWIDEVQIKERPKVFKDGTELMVMRRGDEWLRASELLAGYAYGKPIQAVSDPDGNAMPVVPVQIYLPDNGRSK